MVLGFLGVARFAAYNATGRILSKSLFSLHIVLFLLIKSRQSDYTALSGDLLLIESLLPDIKRPVAENRGVLVL